MASRGINQPSVDQMGAPRRRMLEYLYAQGTAKTSEIRRECDVPQGSKTYHFDRLRVDPSSDDVDTWGYIQEVDRVPSEYGGSDERVWSLTSAGREYVEGTLSLDPTTKDEGLMSRIEALERTVREQQSQINEFNETQEQAKRVADEARSTADSAEMTVQNLRTRVGKNQTGVESLRDDHQSLRGDVNNMGDTIVGKFNELRDDATTRFDNLDGRIELQADRLDERDARIDELEARIDELEPQGPLSDVESKLRRCHQWCKDNW